MCAPTRRRSALADQSGVEIRYYNIIYDLVDDVKAAMSGLLAPTLREMFLGNAQILEVFNITKIGKVAGCRVTDGKVERGAKVRLIRDNVVIHEGTLSTLKRFKDEVREVPAGQECGMAFANYQDIRAGDVIECFNVETDRARRCELRVRPSGSDTVSPGSAPMRVRPRGSDIIHGQSPIRENHRPVAAPAARRRADPACAGRDAGARRDPRRRSGRACHHVPEVRMSPDLRLATVYVMPLGGKDRQAGAGGARPAPANTSAASSRTRSISSSRPTSASCADETFDEAEPHRSAAARPASRVRKDLGTRIRAWHAARRANPSTAG